MHANYVSNLLHYSSKLITLADVIATALGCPGSVLATRLGRVKAKGPSSRRNHEHRGAERWRSGLRSLAKQAKEPKVLTTFAPGTATPFGSFSS